MTTVQRTTRQAKNHGQRAEKEAKPWVKLLARLGFAAKGVVYIVVGVLAWDAAWGTRSSKVNTKDALVEIITQPFGQVLLGVVAFGLLGFVLWRFVQTFLNPENLGNDAKGIVKRIGYVISGVVYVALAAFAIQLILGSGGGGNNNAPEDYTAMVMSRPLGRWLIAAAGGILIVLALVEFYRAYSAKFREKFNLNEMSRTEEVWSTWIGRIGQTARGVVHGIIGGFLIQAAVQYDPEKAGGLGEALQTLAAQPYGFWILSGLSVGLICYGIYCGVLARYRRIYW